MYGGVTLYAGPFLRPSTNNSTFLLPASPAELTEWSHDPTYATPAGYHAYVVWPIPLSLATTNGIAVAFSSCGY